MSAYQPAMTRSIGNNHLPAPVFRGHVGDRLGERPLMAGEIFGAVLPLPEGHVCRFHQDASALGPRPFAVRPRLLDPHGYRVSHLARTRRPTVTTNITDDYRTITELELRPMVLADPDTLNEAEGCR